MTLPERKLNWTLTVGAGIVLLLFGAPATTLAGGVISVEPSIVEPDENGVVRFDIVAAGVPAPG